MANGNQQTDQNSGTNSGTGSNSNPPPPEKDESILGAEPEIEEEGEDSVLGTEDKDEPKADDKDKPPPGAPEKYEPFTLPEGMEANEEQMAEYQAVAKKAGLSQQAAQELLDFHISASQKAADGLTKHWQDTQKTWKAEIAADSKLGPRIKEVRANFSKMLNSLNEVEGISPAQLAANNALITSFREAIILTGIGNNPAFVRLMDRLAENFVEGAHVAGNGPSKAGQNAKGAEGRPSLGQALYGS